MSSAPDFELIQGDNQNPGNEQLNNNERDVVDEIVPIKNTTRNGPSTSTILWVVIGIIIFIIILAGIGYFFYSRHNEATALSQFSL